MADDALGGTLRRFLTVGVGTHRMRRLGVQGDRLQNLGSALRCFFASRRWCR